MTKTLGIIPDINSAIADGHRILRQDLAKGSGGIQPNPLIPGTEQYSDAYLVDWHKKTHDWAAQSVSVYTIADAVVSGNGQIWLDDYLITSSEVMPLYVAQLLEIQAGGNEQLTSVRQLPIREVEEPCLVALGHGSRVYGHFLIEMMFKILLSRRASLFCNGNYKILLSSLSPRWMLDILQEHFGFSLSDIEFIKVGEERVRLLHAIVPGLLIQENRFLPIANDLIEELLSELRLGETGSESRRTFISRVGFHNPAAYQRTCLNEERLISIAVKQHNFLPVSIQELSWREQVTLFRKSDIVVGLAGSGLHNALFSTPGSRLASIGSMNLAQSQIGALRRQHNAFFSKGFDPSRDFKINEDQFAEFLSAVCGTT